MVFQTGLTATAVNLLVDSIRRTRRDSALFLAPGLAGSSSKSQREFVRFSARINFMHLFHWMCEKSFPLRSMFVMKILLLEVGCNASCFALLNEVRKEKKLDSTILPLTV